VTDAGPRDRVKDAHGPGDDQGGRFGALEGEDLGRLFADDDMEEDDQRENDRGGEGMGGGCAEADVGEDGRKDVGEGEFAEPADPEAGQRDADLGGGEIGVEMAQQVKGRARAKNLFRRQTLETRFTHLHERELGGDEKTVERDEDGDSENFPEEGRIQAFAHARRLPWILHAPKEETFLPTATQNRVDWAARSTGGEVESLCLSGNRGFLERQGGAAPKRLGDKVFSVFRGRFFLGSANDSG